MPLSRTGVERQIALAQYPSVKESGPVTGVTPAGEHVIEVSWLGRKDGGAVQVYTADGTAFVATFAIQGTLTPGNFIADGGSGSFDARAREVEWFTLGSVTNRDVIQVGGMFARLRVICTAYTSGTPRVRVL